MTVTDASSDASSKILKQVEFYFSDANLPRDRFLQEELKKNEEGWISLSIISSFKRMQALSTDLAVIAEALKASNLLEVSEDGASVRRVVALPEQPADSMKTCVVVRGFQAGEATTLEEFEEFFGSVCAAGSVAAIRLRRNPQTKAFKGSVFLHLKTEEEAARLVELKTLTRGEESFEVLSMTAFMEEQNAKQMARSNKKDSANSVAEPEVSLTIEDVKKMVLTVTGCPVDLDHRLLRTALASKGPVAFVENVTAEGFSVVRFKEPLAADLITTITSEGGITLPGLESPLQVREPTEEEVQAFFEKMQEFKAKAAATGGKPRHFNKNKRVKRA